MVRPSLLRVLHYPFADPKSDVALKRAVLLFDQVWFMDTSGLLAADVPDKVLADWEKVRRDVKLLLDRQVAVLLDPEPVVRENDHLLAAAFKADLMDNEVWRLFTSPGTPNTMKLLRRKIPPAAFEFLNSQTYGRINYGTARAKALFHKMYMEWPSLRNEKFESSGSPFPTGSYEDQFFRFLFHDGLIARQMNGDYEDVEHTCIFPFTHASSLLVNQAILLASKFELIPFCDSALHAQLLEVKRRRIDVLASQRGENQLVQHTAMPSLAPSIPDSLLDRLDIEKMLHYREHMQEALGPWRASLSGLITLTRTTNVNGEMQNAISRLVETELIPLSRLASQHAIDVYKKLFGSIAESPSVGLGDMEIAGDLYSGLSVPEMLVSANEEALDTESRRTLPVIGREAGCQKHLFCLVQRGHLVPPYAAS